MEDNEHIQEHLKNSLVGFSVQPRVSSFDEILRKLERKRRRRLLFFLLPGLLATGLFFTLFINLQQPEAYAANVVIKENREDKIRAGAQANPDRISGQEPAVASSEPKTKNNEANDPEFPGPGKDIPEQGVLPGAPRETGSAKDSSAGTAENPGEKNAGNLPVYKSHEQQKLPEEVALQDTKENLADRVQENLEPVRVDVLTMRATLLPLEHPEKEIIPLVDQNVPADLTVKDSASKEKWWHLVAGLSYNPGLGTFHYPKNNSSVKSTAATQGAYPQYYQTNRKDKNGIRYNHSWGIRLGIIIKDKWELLGGFGFQRYSLEEYVENLGGISKATADPVRYDSAIPGMDAANGTYKSVYKYFDYSLELNRIHVYKKVLKIKTGMGIHAQQVRYLLNRSGVVTVIGPNEVYYITGRNPYLNPCLFLLSGKIGFMNDLSKRIQFQMNPNFYYSLNSMFRNNYAIKQKPFGLGIECLFLFRLR